MPSISIALADWHPYRTFTKVVYGIHRHREYKPRVIILVKDWFLDIIWASADLPLVLHYTRSQKISL
jgi:hypothetical protein